MYIWLKHFSGVGPEDGDRRGPGQTDVHGPHVQRQAAVPPGAAVVQSGHRGRHSAAALPRRLLPALRPREQVPRAHADKRFLYSNPCSDGVNV